MLRLHDDAGVEMLIWTLKRRRTAFICSLARHRSQELTSIHFASILCFYLWFFTWLIICMARFSSYKIYGWGKTKRYMFRSYRPYSIHKYMESENNDLKFKRKNKGKCWTEQTFFFFYSLLQMHLVLNDPIVPLPALPVPVLPFSSQAFISWKISAHFDSFWLWNRMMFPTVQQPHFF